MTNPVPPEDSPLERPRDVAEPTAPPEPSAPDERRTAGLDRKGRVKRTRASELWIGLITAAVLAVLFLVFIAQNSNKVTIQFLGWEGQVSLAVALLLSAVIGALVVAVPGVVRIVQLRTALRHNAKR
ncbi:LapA family protein [Aeromicrobium wangtongii]|uniref:Lipopolysaccharide assembly protein LapA domain-containing protein n=1 Tax=Aeromicrobium wangtongii TaxID=2969247 RepID=A0ABY5MCA2_9ACTN|nr:lipopolysaccharide assembly protein LapA domain-containing protein [Aeromicrobium wangtongii]MCD9197297.1 lipopolysaccharide assembly protein LapA domain-containing protein [Aeromicrobium wangtongii]UUP14791.1 lipopolysaccharide assembly protein LapA domain-containing protein [Aeromicrobium wangtongii]